MKITSIIWLPAVIEKLAVKHHVTPEEVEEVFSRNPVYRQGPKAKDVVRTFTMRMVKQKQADTCLLCLFTNEIVEH